jgi:hypothetical protein
MRGSGQRNLRRRASSVLRKACAAGVFAVAFSLAAAGCMIPSYQLPAGFSSSYQRQVYGMEPVPPDPNAQDLISIETHAGIFYPMTAFHDAPSPAQQMADGKTMEPMLLPTETPKTTALKPIGTDF